MDMMLLTLLLMGFVLCLIDIYEGNATGAEKAVVVIVVLGLLIIEAVAKCRY